MSEEKSNKNWYDKYHKLILLVPALILVLSIVYLVQFNAANDGIMYKDYSLTGGTAITIFDSSASMSELEDHLAESFPDVSIRILSDTFTGEQQALYIETRSAPEEIVPAIEEHLDYTLTEENSSMEFSGETLSEGFYRQLVASLIAASILMSLVIFYIFGRQQKIKAIVFIVSGLALSVVFPNITVIRAASFFIIIAGLVMGLRSSKGKKGFWPVLAITLAALILYWAAGQDYSASLNNWVLIASSVALLALYARYSVPSITILISLFANLVMTLTVLNLSGFTFSMAGLVALFTIIGFSVDTNILLSTRVLKRKEGSVNDGILGAFKTGITMSIVAIVSILVALIVIYNSSEVLSQIFLILLVGLSFDIFNTWVMNASLIKWYAEAKN